MLGKPSGAISLTSPWLRSSSMSTVAIVTCPHSFTSLCMFVACVHACVLLGAMAHSPVVPVRRRQRQRRQQQRRTPMQQWQRVARMPCGAEARAQDNACTSAPETRGAPDRSKAAVDGAAAPCQAAELRATSASELWSDLRSSEPRRRSSPRRQPRRNRAAVRGRKF